MRGFIGKLGLGLLAVFVTFFAFLALDLAWRVWVTRATFDSVVDVTLIMGLEVVRACVTLVLVGIAVVIARRREPGHAALACALLLVGMWYAKATTFGFPGFAQELLTLRLLDAGASRPVLRWIFGEPSWVLAPAAGLFLAFALRYPAVPEAEAVRSVHATGRRGMMREVALAGTDVRSLLHRTAARALESGALSNRAIAAASVASALGIAAGAPAVRSTAWLVLAAVGLLSLAFLRTAWMVHEGEPRRRLGHLARAALAAFVGLVASGALGFVPGVAVAQVTLVLSSLAPLAAAILLAGWARPCPAGAP